MNPNRRIEWRLAATFLGGLIRGLEDLQKIADLISETEEERPSAITKTKSMKRNRSKQGYR